MTRPSTWGNYPIQAKRSNAERWADSSKMPRKATILVADDDSNDLFLLVKSIEKSGLGHSVIAVINGQEAVDYLSGKPPYNDRIQTPLPDLFLLDLKMPRMNGFEVLLWLQGEEALKQIPVVVLSGSILEKDKAEALGLGAREYCVKPATGDEYIQFVKELHARWLA